MVVSWVVGPFWENLVYRTLQCARGNKGIIGWRSTKFPSGIACDAFRTLHPMRLRRMFGVTVCRHDFLQLTTKMYMRPCDFLLSMKSHHAGPRTTHLGTKSVGWGWVYADTEAYPEMRQTPTVVSTVPWSVCFCLAGCGFAFWVLGEGLVPTTPGFVGGVWAGVHRVRTPRHRRGGWVLRTFPRRWQYGRHPLPRLACAPRVQVHLGLGVVPRVGLALRMSLTRRMRHGSGVFGKVAIET